MDPAGPVPYRFEPDELTALAAGRLPGTDEPIFTTAPSRSVRVSLPGPETIELEQSLAASLAQTDVDAAWLVDSKAPGSIDSCWGWWGRRALRSGWTCRTGPMWSGWRTRCWPR